MTRIKRKLTELEKIFSRYSLNKILILRIHNELQKLNTKRINNAINIWANELNKQFSREVVQMANKCMQKYSKSLDIKDM
jgi:hypothetical protein